MKKVTKFPLAKQDLIGHYDTIAADKFEPAERFLKVAEECFQLLAKMPGAGRKFQTSNPELVELRVYPLPRGFRNYLVFYRISHEEIEIVRVLHAARDVEAVLGAKN